MKTKKVEVKKLRFGMYLAESVRNEDGNLLLSEGIYINRKQQIDRLIENKVTFVEIDLEKSLTIFNTGDSEKLLFSEQSIVHPQGLVDSVKEELVIAEKTYMESKYVLTNVFEQMKYGKTPDNKALNSIITDIIDSVSRNSHALQSLAALRANNAGSFQHSVNVCINTLVLAKKLFKNNDVIFSIGKGALLHDIGKSRLNPKIIDKNEKLTPGEYEIFQRHPTLGLAICREQGIKDEIINEIVLHHHEAYDGSGYPDRLYGKNINRFANIVSIADYYDEITSLNETEKLSPPDAIRAISRLSGKKFDPRIVNHFISNFGIYPIGSFIKFFSGKIGLVITFDKDDITNPVIKLLTDEKQNSIEYPETVTLKNVSEKIVDFNVKFKLDYSLHTIL